VNARIASAVAGALAPDAPDVATVRPEPLAIAWVLSRWVYQDVDADAPADDSVEPAEDDGGDDTDNVDQEPRELDELEAAALFKRQSDKIRCVLAYWRRSYTHPPTHAAFLFTHRRPLLENMDARFAEWRALLPSQFLSMDEQTLR
jgi:hypothetical protein